MGLVDRNIERVQIMYKQPTIYLIRQIYRIK